MVRSLIVVSNAADMTLAIIHADTIQIARPRDNGTEIVTTRGTFQVDESIAEIMQQYNGDIVPNFVVEECEACKQTLTGPTIKDLMAKNMSVRACCIVLSAVPPEFKAEDDDNHSQIPLSVIEHITETQWAGMKNSTPEVAAQICHWIRELMKPKAILTDSLDDVA